MDREFIIKSKKHGEFKVIIDQDDWERVSKHSWHINFNHKKDRYCRIESRINNKLKKLHRFILNIEDPKISIDHINGNTLDNRKCNLRLCTQTQNMRNCKSTKGNKTGFRGVFKNKNKYKACISINNKTFHIPGNFNTAIEAAKVRDEYAFKISGEFAILNFSKKGEA